MPAMSDRWVAIAKFNPDSTHTDLVSISQNGDLFTLGAVNPPSDRYRCTCRW